MRVEEFFILLFSDWRLYLVAFLISGPLVYWLLKRYANSVLDPFCYQLLGTLFANVVPIFLFFTEQINTCNFRNFILIELFFWIGFCSYRRKDYNISKKPPRYKGTYLLFLISAFFVVSTQLYYYSVQGLPIFLESRIDKYSDAISGLGMIERITYVMSPYCILYSFSYFKSINRQKRILSRLFLLFIIFTFLANGSKSAIFGILGPLYFFITYLSKYKIQKRHLLMLGLLGVAFALSIILIMQIVDGGGSGVSPMIQLGRRFLLYGDCYYEAYPYNAIADVNIQHPLKQLFVNFLAPFRLMDYRDGLDMVPSLQIHYGIYPEISVISGPNNRVPILMYSLFGKGGFIFAYIIGRATSFFMYGQIKNIRKDIIGISIYCALYQAVVVSITDPLLMMGNLASFIFGVVFFKCIYSVIIRI